MSFVYDAAVLIAADRDDRQVWADHRARLELGVPPETTAPVVAQVSRSDRQVQLRRFLRGCEIRPFAREHAHMVGALLASAGADDVVDGHLAIVAERSASTVITGDVADLRRLSSHLSSPVRITSV
jgi:predicted nucleic acid-binding protein